MTKTFISAILISKKLKQVYGDISMIKPTKTNKKLQERLARIYIQKIRSSQWIVGSKISSIRSLAVEYGVAAGTVAKAIRILAQD